MNLEQKVAVIRKELGLNWYQFMMFMARKDEKGDLDMSHWNMSKEEVLQLLDILFKA